MVLCAEEEAFSAYGLCEYGAAVLVSSALRVPPYSVGSVCINRMQGTRCENVPRNQAGRNEQMTGFLHNLTHGNPAAVSEALDAPTTFLRTNESSMRLCTTDSCPNSIQLHCRGTDFPLPGGESRTHSSY